MTNHFFNIFFLPLPCMLSILLPSSQLSNLDMTGHQVAAPSDSDISQSSDAKHPSAQLSNSDHTGQQVAALSSSSNDNLQSDHAKLTQQVAVLSDTTNDIKSKIDNATVRLTNIESMLDQLRFQNIDLNKENTSLQDAVDNLQLDLRDLQAKLESLERLMLISNVDDTEDSRKRSDEMLSPRKLSPRSRKSSPDVVNPQRGGSPMLPAIVTADRKEIDSRVSDRKKSDSRVSSRKESGTRVSGRKEIDTRVLDRKESDTRVSDRKESDTKVSGRKESNTRVSDRKESDTSVSEAEGHKLVQKTSSLQQIQAKFKWLAQDTNRQLAGLKESLHATMSDVKRLCAKRDQQQENLLLSKTNISMPHVVSRFALFGQTLSSTYLRLAFQY